MIESCTPPSSPTSIGTRPQYAIIIIRFVWSHFACVCFALSWWFLRTFHVSAVAYWQNTTYSSGCRISKHGGGSAPEQRIDCPEPQLVSVVASRSVHSGSMASVIFWLEHTTNSNPTNINKTWGFAWKCLFARLVFTLSNLKSLCDVVCFQTNKYSDGCSKSIRMQTLSYSIHPSIHSHPIPISQFACMLEHMLIIVGPYSF